MSESRRTRSPVAVVRSDSHKDRESANGSFAVAGPQAPDGSSPTGSPTGSPQGRGRKRRQSRADAAPGSPDGHGPAGSPTTRRRGRGAAKKGERCNVMVMVRVRPLLQYEREDRRKKPSVKGPPKSPVENYSLSRTVLSASEAAPEDQVTPLVLQVQDERHVLVVDPDTQEITSQHTVDRVFWSVDGGCDNAEVYAHTGKVALESALDAFNVCIFAYGQTGSGKTHTVLGHAGESGIAPLLIADLFDAIERDAASGAQYRVFASFMEIYNERVRDLFDTGDSSQEAQRVLQPQMHYTQAASSNLPALLAAQYKERRVREHPVRGIFVEGLTSKEMFSAQECRKAMVSGMRERSTASTKMNQTSSRSHACFQVKVEMSNKRTGLYRCATINLVDLAGSENITKSGAAGATFEEAASINQSLSTLRLVLDKLLEMTQSKAGKTIFVPYRDSVLTRVLQDSLGGNSKTMMIANVSPHFSNLAETRSTLTYAVKAQAITCSVRRNEETTPNLVNTLQGEVELLKQQMDALRDNDNVSEFARDTIEQELQEELERRSAALQEQLDLLEKELAGERQEKQEVRAQLEGDSRKAQLVSAFRQGALQTRLRAMQDAVDGLEEQLEQEKSSCARLKERNAVLQSELQSKDVEIAALKRLVGQATQEAHSTRRHRLGDETARLIASVVCAPPRRPMASPSRPDEGTPRSAASDAAAQALDALTQHSTRLGRSKVSGVNRAPVEPAAAPSPRPMPQGLLPITFQELQQHALPEERWVVVVGDATAAQPLLAAARKNGAAIYAKLPSEAAREAVLQAPVAL